MNISSISQNENSNSIRNLFIRYSNSFMSNPQTENPVEKAGALNPADTGKPKKMGIENLQEFTIFPKQVVDGKTIITA